MKFYKIKQLVIAVAWLFSLGMQAETPDFSMIGFATIDGGTTGGAAGETVTPTTYAELKQYIESATPYVIQITKEFNTGIQTWVDIDGAIVESTATGAFETTFGDILMVGSNKTIIGVGDQAFFNRIGLVIQCQSNIIIRNIKFTMQYVPATKDGEYKILKPDGVTTVGDPDCIGIQADKDSFTEEQRKSYHIWVDHCEFFNEPESAGVYKDRYDGLLDSKNNVKYMTISWCYFHDHSKAMLSGKGSSDAYNRTVTYHHNYFKNIYGSRLPLLRLGQHHYFNNYMENCADGVNLRIGSNAYIENCYFKDSKAPIFGKTGDSSSTYDAGQAYLNDLIFNNCSKLPGGYANLDGVKYESLKSDLEFERVCNFTPSDLYSYSNVLTATTDVPSVVVQYSGVGKISAAPNAVEINSTSTNNVWASQNGVVIKAEPETVATICDLTGRVITTVALIDAVTTIDLNEKGYYIVSLVKNSAKSTYKVIF